MGDGDDGSAGQNERKEAKGFLRGCLAKGDAFSRGNEHRGIATPSFLISSL